MTKPRRARLRTRDFQVLLGVSLAALSAAVVWLAMHSRHVATADPRVATLAQRADVLEQKLASVSKQLADVQNAAAATAAQSQDQQTQIARLKAQPQLGTRCLNQVQQEVDDIRGYIAFGGAIRRRISPDCAKILAPRFGG